jgi:PEP-CTERM motif-containing protein
MVGRIVASLVLSLAIATAAAADPVTLTSGGIQTNDDYIGSFSFSGSGFAAEGQGLGVPIVSRFKVGSVDFSGDFELFAVNDMNDGRVTAGGQTFRGFAFASFHVVADPIVIATTDRGPHRFTTPFRADGVVQLSDGPRGSGNLLFSQDVTGSGMLWWIADTLDPGAFATRSMGLTFSPAESPAPTPEPGSLLLMGTGLGALWRFRRFRRARA